MSEVKVVVQEELFERHQTDVDDREIEFETVDYTEESQELEQIPKEVRNLRIQSYDKGVEDLVKMIERGDVILNPEYQRNYVWDNKKASLLIESILLNIPIPVIYASEEEDIKWNIVDGLQRLYSLLRYYKNSFKLSGLSILSELNGKRYSELPDKARRLLNNGNLRVILIFNDSHPEIKYDIFQRLNTGSVKLNEQELRNCIYRGTLNNSLKEMVKNKRFQSILGLNAPHKRMLDCEMILRYLALRNNYDNETYEISNYKGVMKPFLNAYMYNNKNLAEPKIRAIEHGFSELVNSVYGVFGEGAFRKLNLETRKVENRLNKSLMDVIMLSFSQYTTQDILSKKDEILDLFLRMLNNDEFITSISTATSDTKALHTRLSLWGSNFESLMEG
ncbi:DUF262 domain-containing protein [Lysinibacillus endophyticus]|uniref:DUF262 domain-containing protein n=1 Tax=Ureibacillus endophyticus TaxID=1978490 RepID=UPI0031366099